MNDLEFDTIENILSVQQRAVVELAVLEKYLHDPAFINRFIDAAANGDSEIARTSYYPKEKRIAPEEFCDGGYQFFNDKQEIYALEFYERLNKEIEPSKVEQFLSAFGKLWVDGSTDRHSSKEMMGIKASIRDHDRHYYPKKHVFMNSKNSVPDSVAALFTPEEMHIVFNITSQLADTCIEDYLESRVDSDSNSINRIYLHRGIFFPAERINDSVLVEEHSLSSYSMAVTVPEVFAQTFTPTTKDTGEPAMFAAPYPIFNNRIVMFAPFMRGMKLGQLEVCVAPPIEVFPLRNLGCFSSGQPGLNFHEYEFDSLPPSTRWTGPLPDRIIKNSI